MLLKKNISTRSFIDLIYFCILFSIIPSYSSSEILANGNDKTSNVIKSEESGWDQVPEILKKIVVPKFPNRKFNIVDYGAVVDGKILCTNAFEKAIEECNKAGGGIVEVPKGTFLTGAIHLKSNVNLHLNKDATVKFSTDPTDYLPLVHTRYEGIECMNYSPLIFAEGKENIAITGKGIFDGQADNEHWWLWNGSERFGWEKGMPSQRDEGNRPALSKMNDEKVPLKERIFGEGHYLRPTMVEFSNSKNILIEGVTFKNAPFWILHPLLSTNITIDGVTTNSLGPNNDGCDPESCSFVHIKNCVFINGDDCIAIKSGRNSDGRIANVPSTNFVIQNCKMEDGHGGVVIGSEITGGAWNIYAEDCEMDSPNLDRALRIKSNAKRGGVVKNIYMRNVKIGQVKEAIVKVNLHYDTNEAEGYNNKPVVKDIYVDHVTSNKSEYALHLDGLKNSIVENINIIDCKFNGVKKGNYLNNVEGVHLNNVYINGEQAIINN